MEIVMGISRFFRLQMEFLPDYMPLMGETVESVGIPSTWICSSLAFMAAAPK
jgi:hypothetical protein